MPNRHVNPHPPRFRLLALASAILAVLASVVAGLLGAAPANAASQGAGFGTWAPVSAYGWHGSMLVNGVHTYCITPGAPAPTGASVDQGVSGSAAGLNPSQLTAINMLVSTYGQTDDAVQAAAVGWAVKAIADWDETLHAFGYRGDSLAGAIDWTFSRLAPDHNVAVQQRAVAYYGEATRLAAGAASASGTVAFTWDDADPLAGTVQVDATIAATGSLRLTNAVFEDTGQVFRGDAAAGTRYAIRMSPPAAGRPYEVAASGRFSAGFTAAVRHFVTAGGQDTAGPAGKLEFEVAGGQQRVPPFSPAITTQVGSRYAPGGPFVDDVSFATTAGEWPRGEDGSYLPVSARAAVYRTETEPVPTSSPPPEEAVAGELALVTDPATGPEGPYTVRSEWTMAEPGFYTAVWTIRGEDQSEVVRRHLGDDFVWTEQFGERSQVTMVPSIATQAQPAAVVGEPISDTIRVSAPIPADGLRVAGAVYRAAEGVPPEASCVTENLVWESAWIDVATPGDHVVTAPAIELAGTYYWQERAVDRTGETVHVGVCGIPNETTTVSAPDVPGAPGQADEPPLAATGVSETWVRAASGSAIALLTAGAALVALPRRRFGAAVNIR